VSALATIALAAAAGLVFALVISLVLQAGEPLLRRALGGAHPARRARALLAATAAPTLVPILLVGVCLAPGLLGGLGLHADHCVGHPGHVHLCLVHPSAALTPPLALLLAGLVGGAVWAATRGGRRVRALGASTARLRVGASPAAVGGVRRVESERPFSWTAGILRGEIFVSSALEERLSPEAFEAVLEHERAHVRRRDGLRRVLARALSWPLAPGVRRRLLRDLDRAIERACDEQAGARLGDRLRVAEALLAVERLVGGAPAGAGRLAFGGSSVPERVDGLLAPLPPEPEGSMLRVAGACAVLGTGLVLGADPLHHATEHGLGWLLAVL